MSPEQRIELLEIKRRMGSWTVNVPDHPRAAEFLEMANMAIPFALEESHVVIRKADMTVIFKERVLTPKHRAKNNQPTEVFAQLHYEKWTHQKVSGGLLEISNSELRKVESYGGDWVVNAVGQILHELHEASYFMESERYLPKVSQALVGDLLYIEHEHEQIANARTLRTFRMCGIGIFSVGKTTDMGTSKENK